MKNQNEQIAFDEEMEVYMGVNSENHFWPIEDICEFLEITDVDQAMAELEPDQIAVGSVEPDTNDSEVQDTTFIDHSAVLTLVMQSQAPIAKKFRRWVARIALPNVFAPNPFSYDMDMSIKEELSDCGLLPWWAYGNF